MQAKEPARRQGKVLQAPRRREHDGASVFHLQPNFQPPRIVSLIAHGVAIRSGNADVEVPARTSTIGSAHLQ